MSDDREPDWPGPPDDGGRPDPAAIDAQLPAVEAYCRAVTGREDEAVRAAGVVIESARSLLTDPERLRAWLLANARRELLGDAAPTAQEAFDLVHRHGIQPEDLPVVLGMPPTEADELLAAAEEELGWGTNWSDTAYANESNPDLPAVGSSGGMFDTQLPAVVAYCRAVTGREDDAVTAAGVVIESARSLLTDPQRLHAWLLANARRELLGDAAPTAQEASDLVRRHGIQPEDLPVVLGMPPTEADELLAAAEEEYAGNTVDSGQDAAGPSPSDGLDEHRSWDDRAAAWSDIAAIDDDAGSDAGSDDDSEWDEVFGPKSHRLQDIYGLFRKQPEAAARHAAPRIGADLREVLANGRHVQAAAAAGCTWLRPTARRARRLTRLKTARPPWRNPRQPRPARQRERGRSGEQVHRSPSRCRHSRRPRRRRSPRRASRRPSQARRRRGQAPRRRNRARRRRPRRRHPRLRLRAQADHAEWAGRTGRRARGHPPDRTGPSPRVKGIATSQMCSSVAAKSGSMPGT